MPYEVWDWDETLAPPWDPLRKESFLIEPVCDWSCPSVDSWPIFKCSPILFRNKTTEMCVSHCRKFVWKSHPHYSHMGIFWAKKGSSRICIQYWAPKTLVSCPTRWFLLLTFGFLWWSSSWWWQPHIAGCKLFWPLLRAGMTNSDHSFCKMYFKYVSLGCQKNLVHSFMCFTSPKDNFFQLGPKCQNWGANVRIEEQRGNCVQIIAMINGR